MGRCELTGKCPVSSNLVSHSNIKTKHTLLPNIQKKRLFSQSLGQLVRLKVATSTIRNMEHVGGLDPFILRQTDEKLSPKAKKLKKRIRDRLAGKGKKRSPKGDPK